MSRALFLVARDEALARRGRDHIREHLQGTQAGTPTRRLPAGVPPALRPGRSQRWLNAVPAASQRRRRACYASTFLDSKSQFSFLVSQRPGSEGDSSFLCADYRMKREFILFLDSSAGLRAVGPVIKFQDAEKVNSQKRSEIPISAEEIATPSRKRPHRILLVTRNPFADPNSAQGESRRS